MTFINSQGLTRSYVKTNNRRDTVPSPVTYFICSDYSHTIKSNKNISYLHNPYFQTGVIVISYINAFYCPHAISSLSGLLSDSTDGKMANFTLTQHKHTPTHS